MPDGYRTDTAIGHAFAAAGYEPPDQKLRRLIREAIGRTNDNTNRTYGQVMGAVGNSLELLFTMTQDYHRAAFNDWIKKERDAIAVERAKIQQQQKDSGARTTTNPTTATPQSSAGGATNPVSAPHTESVGGQPQGETQIRSAPNSAGEPNAPGTHSEGHVRPETQERRAPAKAGTGNPGSSRPLTAGEARKLGWREAREHTMRVVCRLDTFMVNGRPVGDLTVSEAREWAKERQTTAREAARDTRFVLILCANLRGDMVLRDHWKNADEIESLYKKAEAEYAGWL